MVGVGGVGLYTGVLVALALFVTAVVRYELEMTVVTSALTAVSVTAAGLMVAVTLEVALAVPFAWSLAGLSTVAVLLVVLYERAS